MDKNTFNKLLQNPNYAPLFSELEKLPVDRLIELLHQLGFKCGSALDLKQVILWSIGDELIARKMSLMNPKAKPKVIRSAPYNHYVQEINRRFKKLEQEGDDKKLSTAVPYLLDKLNELKNAQRHPEDVGKYMHENFINATELRMLRWVWKSQERNHLQSIASQQGVVQQGKSNSANAVQRGRVPTLTQPATPSESKPVKAKTHQAECLA